MSRQAIGWLSFLLSCLVGLVFWYLYSMFQFYHGWMRLDPLCCAGSYGSCAMRVVDDRYTRGAAEAVRAAIVREYREDAVFVDGEGTVFIRPAIFFGDMDFLDRFGQWALTPEDGRHPYNGPGLACEALQPYVRSPIDMLALKRLDWPFSLYASLHDDIDMQESWRRLYGARR